MIRKIELPEHLSGEEKVEMATQLFLDDFGLSSDWKIDPDELKEDESVGILTPDNLMRLYREWVELHFVGSDEALLYGDRDAVRMAVEIFYTAMEKKTRWVQTKRPSGILTEGWLIPPREEFRERSRAFYRDVEERNTAELRNFSIIIVVLAAAIMLAVLISLGPVALLRGLGFLLGIGGLMWVGSLFIRNRTCPRPEDP